MLRFTSHLPRHGQRDTTSGDVRTALIANGDTTS
jgi:hypothetical protein